MHIPTRTHYQEREEGFTLVELLVVILIIGILAAIAIPVFLNQRKTSNDTTLKSDLKNSSLVVETWLAEGNGVKEYYQAIGANGRVTSIVTGEGAVQSFPVGTAKWNDVPSFPKITVSNGVTMEIIMVNVPNVNTSRAHQDGEYCLTAVNTNSNYDRVPYGGTGDKNLDKVMYYDTAGGGLRTMQELVKARSEGTFLSCETHVFRYLKANGQI